MSLKINESDKAEGPGPAGGSGEEVARPAGAWSGLPAGLAQPPPAAGEAQGLGLRSPRSPRLEPCWWPGRAAALQRRWPGSSDYRGAGRRGLPSGRAGDPIAAPEICLAAASRKPRRGLWRIQSKCVIANAAGTP